MKHADIVIGGTYWAKIGPVQRMVRVIREEKSYGSTKTKFRVVTQDGKELPKLRTAASLHPL